VVLLRVILELVMIVGGLLTIATLTIVGSDRLSRGLSDWRGRLRETWRYFAALLAVLGLNKVARDYGPEFSWLLNWNVTGLIYRIEGDAVAAIQSTATPGQTAVFGFAYVYGYAVLLIFPFVAYFVLETGRPLKRTIIAYGINYVVGVACYTVFVSYGPRNLLPDLVSPLLYTEYPLSKVLTSTVNTNTNVFPSLHSSLSATVALLAWQTRGPYPRWPVVAVPLAIGVVYSTMYLGIHWVVDVVAGILLGVGSVVVATRMTRIDAGAEPDPSDRPESCDRHDLR
jgi:membrane-associated phospholipid phosphatase